jgi:penicillin-binding protein 1A
MDVAHRLGIESPLPEDLTLALGSSDLSLIELTAAYAALANQGTFLRPVAVRYVVDAQGRLLEENTPEGRQALSPELAYVVTHMLRGTVQRGTGSAAKALGRPIAGKTGTTNDYSNAWFVGFTPSLATGVWVGYDRPRTLGRDETGSRAALPIWMAFMSRALAGSPVEDFAVPERIVVMPVDLDGSSECGRAVPMAFVAGTQPTEGCGPARGATTAAGSVIQVAPVPTRRGGAGAPPDGAPPIPGANATPAPVPSRPAVGTAGAPGGPQPLALPPRPGAQSP